MFPKSVFDFHLVQSSRLANPVKVPTMEYGGLEIYGTTYNVLNRRRFSSYFEMASEHVSGKYVLETMSEQQKESSRNWIH